MPEWRTNDKILDPPQNLVASIEQISGANRLSLQWFQPQSAPATPPLIGIQVWANTNTTSPTTYDSHIWRLPYVIPYIETFWSFAPGAWNNETEIIDKVLRVRNNLVSNGHRTIQNFQWAWWPNRYGTDGPGNTPGNPDSLFYHHNDRVSVGGNPEHMMFCAAGRALWKPATLAILQNLKPLLVNNDLPDPIYVNPDYEGGMGLPDSSVRHNAVKADARANSELIDGTVTYNQWVASLKDWNNESIPESYLADTFPWIYDGVYDSPPNLARQRVGALYNSLRFAVKDWVLHDTLYSSCKQVFPNIICGNWDVFTASRETLAHSFRFRESPYHFSNLKADFSMPQRYGISIADWYEQLPYIQPLGSGYATFKENIHRFGIDESLYQNAPNGKNDLLRRIYLEGLQNDLKGSYDTSFPINKRQAVSIAWQHPNIWPGGISVGATTSNQGRFWPEYMNGASFNFANSPEVVTEMFKIFKRFNISLIEVFAQDANKTSMDHMLSVLPTALSNAGYTV